MKVPCPECLRPATLRPGRSVPDCKYCRRSRCRGRGGAALLDPPGHAERLAELARRAELKLPLFGRRR